VRTAVHHPVVTLAQGASLYLWDLAQNAPYHVVSARVTHGTELTHGTVVRFSLENGRPVSVGPARRAELTSQELHLLDAISRELSALAAKERELGGRGMREPM
jgi:hypothetical protein